MHHRNPVIYSNVAGDDHGAKTCKPVMAATWHTHRMIEQLLNLKLTISI
jgi:hypothetical protein